jgi:hypothetical protein
MKIELTYSEVSNLAADELFLAKQWLKDYLFWKQRGESESASCKTVRKFMLESFKMWKKLRSSY